MAGPRKYDRDKLVPIICARLEQGEPLAQICREPGMPDTLTVWQWEKDDEEVAKAIARARELGGDAIAADALRIADDLSDDPASRRVRVETRLKLLAKWHPRRYGERIEQVHSGGVTVTISQSDSGVL